MTGDRAGELPTQKRTSRAARVQPRSYRKTRGHLITRPYTSNLGVPASATIDFRLNSPLEPASPTVPTTSKNKNYEDDDD